MIVLVALVLPLAAVLPVLAKHEEKVAREDASCCCGFRACTTNAVADRRLRKAKWVANAMMDVMVNTKLGRLCPLIVMVKEVTVPTVFFASRAFHRHHQFSHHVKDLEKAFLFFTIM